MGCCIPNTTNDESKLRLLSDAITDEIETFSTHNKSNRIYSGVGIDILNMFADCICLFIGDIKMILLLMQHNFIQNKLSCKNEIYCLHSNLINILNSFPVPRYQSWDANFVNYTLNVLTIKFSDDMINNNDILLPSLQSIIGYIHKEQNNLLYDAPLECNKNEFSIRLCGLKTIDVDMQYQNNINHFLQKYSSNTNDNNWILDKQDSSTYEYKLYECDSLYQIISNTQLNSEIRDKFMQKFDVKNFVENFNSSIYFNGDLIHVHKWLICYTLKTITGLPMCDVDCALGVFGVIKTDKTISTNNDHLLLSFCINYFISDEP